MRLVWALAVFALLLPCTAAKAEAPETTAPLGLAVSADGSLLLRGEPCRAIGVNYFDAMFRCLEGKDPTWRDGLHYLGQRRVPFIRFMCGAYWPNQWKLYRENKTEYFRRMDAFVKAAETENIGLIPSFFWQINSFPDLVFEPINRWGRTDSDTREFMRTYTREVVSRYKDSPAMWAWEFGNEMNLEVDLPHHKPQVSVENGTPFMRTSADRISTADMTAALEDFARNVRAIDPHRAIFSGHATPRPAAWHLLHEKNWNLDTEAQFREILRVQNPDPINTVSIHVYTDQKTAYAFARETSAPLTRLMQVAASEAVKAGKPLFVGEFGSPSNVNKQLEKATFDELLSAIIDAKIPLSAVWVFDYAPQHSDWNIKPGGPREYQLEAIIRLNNEWNSAVSPAAKP